MRSLYRVFVPVIMVVVASTTSHALTVPANGMLLSDLLGGGSILSGGLVFNDFTYVAVGDMPTADHVMVSPITDLSGNSGLRFSAPFYDLGDGASMVLLGYGVHVADPPHKSINAASLMGNPAVIGSDGIATIVQTFLPMQPDAQLTLQDLANGGFHGAAEASFSMSHDDLVVQQSMLLDGIGSSVASLTFFDTTYRVVNNPEPATSAMLALAAICMVTVGRRPRRHLAA